MLTHLILMSLLGAQSGGQGHPWDLTDFHSDPGVPQVFGPSQKQQQECRRSGSVCFAPGGSATSEGVELRVGAPPITVLTRGAQVAAVGAVHGTSPDQPWQVEMVANLARQSTNAPIVVALLDGEDAEAVAHHLAILVWDVHTTPTRHLGLRFLLSPDEGVRSSHSYLLRVVQKQGKSERLLAAGEFHLE